MKNGLGEILTVLVIGTAALPITEFARVDLDSSRPAPRHLEEVAYDQNTGRLFVFGGIEITGNSWAEPDDVWVFERNTWKRFPGHGPCGRRGHAMAFNSTENSLVIIGGVTKGRAQDSVLHDVWKWKDGTWLRMNAYCPVKSARATYDSKNDRILVYGDANNPDEDWVGGEPRRYEIWQLSSEKWTRLSDKCPDPEGQQQMVYNAAQQSLLMVLWRNQGVEVLEWKNGNWSATFRNSGTPPYREKFPIAFLPNDNSIYMFGGRSANDKFLGDYWRWDGKNWSEVSSGKMPTPRASARLIAANDGLVLYGGSTDKGLSNELWHWNGETWKILE